MNPDLVRKVITVIRYSLMFSGINDVINFHFTRGEHKTYFFRVLHSGTCKCTVFYQYECSGVVRVSVTLPVIHFCSFFDEHQKMCIS